MIREILNKLVDKKDLAFEEAEKVFLSILEGTLTDSQIGAFLTALRIKGETEQEIWAAADVARKKARKVNVRDSSLLDIAVDDEPLIDTCGTGGSGIEKFNISTAVSFVVSSAGVKVAKHGNRAASSRCGSADVLEIMGVRIDVEPSVMAKAIKSTGIGFLFAPLYHKAFKNVAGVRREIGIRTIFNLVGPLCNPAFVDYHLMGVYEKPLIYKMARVLKYLQVKKAFVVWSKDLGDEVSLCGPTEVCFLNGRRITNLRLRPSDFGLKKVSLKDVLVSSPEESARLILDIFSGKEGGAKDTVLANASCCFYILGKVKTLSEGVDLARHLIDSGKVKDKFHAFKKFLEDKGKI